MTVGQRIAQKRKEMGLSQEALGDRLGVSRQSIYKWESDSALPEVEKLITLAKLFGVSVGWLLGVEEVAAPENSGELTKTQRKMVEEIVDRYIAALPKPAPQRKWLRILAGFALLVLFFYLINRLDQIDQQYHRVQMTVTHVQDSVDSQINGISSRVEEILKAQNNLTAEYGTALVLTNLEKNQVVFNIYAVPKTYEEGMTVKFSADDGTGGIQSSMGEEGFNQRFSATLACQLTDSITLSVVFISPDGSRQTQLLDTYEGLYSKTLPYAYIDICDNLSRSALTEPFLYTIPAPDKTPVEYVMLDTEQQGTTAVKELRVGFFRNKELVAWAEPCETPDHFLGFDQYDLCCVLPGLQIRLAAGDELCFAAVVTDTYGRESIYTGSSCILSESGTELLWIDGWSSYIDTPVNWTY